MLKKVAIKIMARLTKSQVSRWASNPIETQKKQLNYLIKNALNTSFGQAHSFSKIKSYDDFKNHIPVRDYEGLREYFEQIKVFLLRLRMPLLPLFWIGDYLFRDKR